MSWNALKILLAQVPCLNITWNCREKTFKEFFEKYCYKVHGLSKTKWIINICYFIYEKGRYGHSKKSLTNYVLHVYKKQENRSISCNDSCTKFKNIRFPMLFKRKTNYTDLSLKYFLWNFSGYWRCVVSANLCGIYDQSVQIKLFFS